MSSPEVIGNGDTPPRPRNRKALRGVFLIAVGFLTFLVWTVLFTIVHTQVRDQRLAESWRDVVMLVWPLLPFAVPAVIAWRFRHVPLWLMTGVIALTVASYAALFLIA